MKSVVTIVLPEEQCVTNHCDPIFLTLFFVFLVDSKIGRAKFDNEYTDTDMLEILRDISLFICTRGIDRHGDNENPSAELPPGASSWVSAGKNLIST